MPTLEELTASIDRTVMDALGDAIAYTVAATGAVLSIRAHIDYSSGAIGLQAGYASEQMPDTITLLIADLPGKPERADSIAIGRRPGETFAPRNVRRDSDGTHWVADLGRA